MIPSLVIYEFLTQKDLVASKMPASLPCYIVEAPLALPNWNSYKRFVSAVHKICERRKVSKFRLWSQGGDCWVAFAVFKVDEQILSRLKEIREEAMMLFMEAETTADQLKLERQRVQLRECCCQKSKKEKGGTK